MRWAGQLAERHGARLSAVLVAPTNTDSADAAEMKSDLEASIGRTTATSARAPIDVHVVLGDDVAETIVRFAESAAADVLVVGNAGMRGRTEFLLGNVANRVTHRSRCTTVVVQSNADSSPVATGDAEHELGTSARAVEIMRVARRGALHNMVRDPGTGDAARAQAIRLRVALEQLGPTFAKLGQILSTRPDLVPREFVEELSLLRSKVTPLPEADVVRAMERELGVPWEDVFAYIEPQPIAAGTIGQVHRALLVDGDRVVVKVQRPTAAAMIEQDLAVLSAVARIAHGAVVRNLLDIVSVVDQLAASLRAELDFGERPIISSGCTRSCSDTS